MAGIGDDAVVERPMSSLRRFVPKWPVQLFLLPLVNILILFLSAGRLDWFWGWVFATVYLLSSLLNYALVRDPGLITERERPKVGAMEWDVQMLRQYGLSLIATLIIAGLNERYQWSPALPMWLHIIGLVIILFTAILGTWAMRENTYFAVYVRIQADRGQTVVTDGPYSIIRHPGNLDMWHGPAPWIALGSNPGCSRGDRRHKPDCS